MPEEINRMVTDAISDWFFVTEPSGMTHLANEGHPADRVFHVGHVMVDNVLHQAQRLQASGLASVGRRSAAGWRASTGLEAGLKSAYADFSAAQALA